MKIDNNILLIFLALAVIYFFFRKNKENFIDLSPEQESFINNLYNYINDNDLTYELYLSYLNTIKNTNLNIVTEEVFNEFKSLKSRGMFTKQKIMAKMFTF